MKRLTILAVLVSVVIGASGNSLAQEPKLAEPTKEHERLKQFAGEWEFTAETVPARGQESMKCEGSEAATMVGDFWLMSQAQATMMGMPVKSVLTLGFDPNKKHYLGTFVCSMDSAMWKYEGSFDDSGKKLTLEAEGPSPLDPTKRAQFREVLELKDKDHKEFTSYLRGDDGNWIKIVTIKYTRKQ